MAISRLVVVGSLAVIVHELTVSDVRDWIRRQEISGLRDPIHALVFEDFGIDDLAEMSDATAAQLEAFAPSDLADLVKACKEINPHFFRLRAAISNTARAMLAAAQPKTWSDLPASS